jgi:Mrp family chromosome partitioning ATPase
MAQHPKIPILGMVENLSDEGLFGAGDVEKSAVELAVPYRDEVPLERRIIRLAD